MRVAAIFFKGTDKLPTAWQDNLCDPNKLETIATATAQVILPAFCRALLEHMMEQRHA